MVDSPDLEIRSLETLNDIRELVPLFTSGFPEIIDSVPDLAKWIEWKYRSPASRSASQIALYRGALVGFYGVLPRSYVHKGQKTIVGLVCDVVTLSEFRRMGIFSALGRGARASGMALIGFPRRREVMPGHLKNGFVVAFRMPVYIRAVAPTMTRSSAWRTRTNLDDVKRDGMVTVDSLNEFVEQTRNARRASSGIRMRLERSDEFLYWRLQQPGAKYTFIFCGHRQAFAIATIRSVLGMRSLWIMDMYDVTGCCTKPLFAGLTDLARQHSARSIVTCTNVAERRRLGLLVRGFVRTPASFQVIVRHAIHEGVDALNTNSDSWSLFWIDSDTV